MRKAWLCGLAMVLGAVRWGEAQEAGPLPPSDQASKAALESSSRHGEFVDIEVPGLGRKIQTWVVFPERPDKAPIVLVIHEIFGLTDWIRGVADQLAKDGFIALAPDLVSGLGPDGGNTASMDRSEAIAKVRGLANDEVVASLNAVRDYGLKLPAANGKSGSIGFCWGGGASFHYATAQVALNAAVVYYGTSPATEALAGVQASVLGLYGGNDARVNTTIGPAETEMKRLGKVYEYEIYEGAGHGFLRAQEAPPANLEATRRAWPRTVAFLRQHAGG